MGQSNHTPGPWHVSSTHLGRARDIGAADGSNIALVSGPEENGATEFKANGRLIASAPVLPDLYDSEINFEIATFWDGGFTVKLGDGMNGFKAESQTRTYVEAVEQLREWAIEHFPHSDFANKYRGPV